MAGREMDRMGGNREWFAHHAETVSHVSRAAAAENVTPNQTLGGVRRRTLTGDLPFLFTTYDDETVCEEIVARISAHPLLGADRIRVQVSNGIATLSGAVVSQRERELAEDIAAGTRGVTRVRSDLRPIRA